MQVLCGNRVGGRKREEKKKKRGCGILYLWDFGGRASHRHASLLWAVVFEAHEAITRRDMLVDVYPIKSHLIIEIRGVYVR